MTYRSTGLKPTVTRMADGELTIRETTHPLRLRVEFHGVQTDPWGGTCGGLSATGELNRKDFGISFDMPMDGGGLVVGEKIQLHLEIEAVLKQ